MIRRILVSDVKSKKNTLLKEEKAAVMLEAVIVFPIVLFTVFVLIYLGLFKMQEMAMLYQVQRVAHQGAMVVAVPGYSKLGNYSSKKIDFESPPSDVEEYFKEAHKNIKTLYREYSGYVGWTSEGEMQAFLEQLSESTLLLAGGELVNKNVTINRSFFSTRINAEVTFQFKTPAVMLFFGFPEHLQYKQAAVSHAIYPSGFVRTVDLATDACVVISEKLGIKEDLGKILDGIVKYIF